MCICMGYFYVLSFFKVLCLYSVSWFMVNIGDFLIDSMPFASFLLFHHGHYAARVLCVL